MDVLYAAWVAAGAPGADLADEAEQCAQCGRPGAGLPVSAAVSKVFTGFDRWQQPTGRTLCPACAWSYRSPSLRTEVHLVRQDGPTLEPIAQPARWLLEADGDLRSVCLIVPLRPGRKHLLPSAAWHTITTDDVTVSWSAAENERLTALRWLQSAGFTVPALRAAAPPWAALSRVERSRWGQVLHAWSELDPWRANSLWFDLAAALTRKRFDR